MDEEGKNKRRMRNGYPLRNRTVNPRNISMIAEICRFWIYMLTNPGGIKLICTGTVWYGVFA